MCVFIGVGVGSDLKQENKKKTEKQRYKRYSRYTSPQNTEKQAVSTAKIALHLA